MGLCEEKRTLDPQIQDRRYELPPVGMVVGGKGVQEEPGSLRSGRASYKDEDVRDSGPSHGVQGPWGTVWEKGNGGGGQPRGGREADAAGVAYLGSDPGNYLISNAGMHIYITQ